MKFGSIVLIHNFSKERNTVPVETVTRTYVSIRWGQSGTYDLNLKLNVLTARSQKAQRKGKAHWSAEDIDEVRRMVKVHLDGVDKKDETRKAMSAHVASMPGVSSPEHISSVLDRSFKEHIIAQAEEAANESDPPLAIDEQSQSNPRIEPAQPERPDLGVRSEYDPKCLGTNGQGHVTNCKCIPIFHCSECLLHSGYHDLGCRGGHMVRGLAPWKQNAVR